MHVDKSWFTRILGLQRASTIRSGIVDEDVDASLSVHNGLDDLIYVLIVRDVEPQSVDIGVLEPVHGFRAPGRGIYDAVLLCIGIATT